MTKKPRKRGRPAKGEKREPVPLKRLDRQIALSAKEAVLELPTVCDRGTKKNAKGYKTSWNGYKLHLDINDTGFPISALVTSASLHDSQVAIPLIKQSSSKVNYLYDLMDDSGDLVNIVLTARSEPFEGINETINFQKGNIIAKIDDFRKMVVWMDDAIDKWTYWPKDVGHNRALCQPFSNNKRDWREVELSTLLMLFVKDMVISGDRFSKFSFSTEWQKLGIKE